MQCFPKLQTNRANREANCSRTHSFIVKKYNTNTSMIELRLTTMATVFSVTDRCTILRHSGLGRGKTYYQAFLTLNGTTEWRFRTRKDLSETEKLL